MEVASVFSVAPAGALEVEVALTHGSRHGLPSGAAAAAETASCARAARAWAPVPTLSRASEVEADCSTAEEADPSPLKTAARDDKASDAAVDCAADGSSCSGMSANLAG